MEAFKKITALAAAFNRPNVDTDLLVPKQFLTHIERTGFGRFLFYNLRFKEDGQENPDFFLNQPRYKGTKILVSRENFGCGSSREHAPWALADYGFRVIIAPSFGDIFKNNSFKIGLLLVELSGELTTDLLNRIEANPGYNLTVDLAHQTLVGSDFTASFEIDPYLKERLLYGWDDISLTLEREEQIQAYEKKHARPWQAVLPVN